MIEHQIKFRKADISDINLLRFWDKQPHIIEGKTEVDWGWETELAKDYEWREMLIAELNGKPIGFIQIIDPSKEETHYWGNVTNDLRAIDIWIGEADKIGKGYGTEMMKLAIDRCFESRSVNAILVDPLQSNTKAHRFYKKIGFKFLMKERFGNDKCFIFRLTRDDWNKKNNLSK